MASTSPYFYYTRSRAKEEKLRSISNGTAVGPIKSILNSLSEERGKEAVDELFRCFFNPAEPKVFFESTSSKCSKNRNKSSRTYILARKLEIYLFHPNALGKMGETTISYSTFKKKWEKQPFLIRRSDSNYYMGLCSLEKFKETVSQNYFRDDSEIDVVAYVDGERKTKTKDIKVLPSFIWRDFIEGYSIRMRNFQVYSKPLESLCTLLQEYLSSYVYANMYLTPAGTQGFPPHYDGTDAFILQIKGKNLWKLYTPSKNGMLASHSSPDLSEAEIGEPCMEVELHPGDMLYFPRGYIHQAKAAPGTLSFHLTLSISQLNTWGDLLHYAVTNAVQEAREKDIDFRRSIPKDYMNYIGKIHSHSDSKERQDFHEKAFSLIEKTLKHVTFDYAADEQYSNFIHGSMPPFLTEMEKKHSVHKNGACYDNGEVLVSTELCLNTKIRLIQRKAFQLVVDCCGARLVHSLYNSKNQKEKQGNCVEVDPENVPALSQLFKMYPDYVKIEDLPHEKSAQLLKCLQPLYDNGFLLTEGLLPFED